jgi:hypothetical protein
MGAMAAIDYPLERVKLVRSLFIPQTGHRSAFHLLRKNNGKLAGIYRPMELIFLLEPLSHKKC